MIIKCKRISDLKVGRERDITFNIDDIDFYDLYMENDLEELLNEIPYEELEEYMAKRKLANEK
jgi:hypothetical protein